MDGLLTLFLFAGFFYLMMRFTCGVHMVHGDHSGHAGRDHGDVNHRDPVCNIKVEMRTGYGIMHEGKLYRFCSRNCMDKFEAEPAKYLNSLVVNGGKN